MAWSALSLSSKGTKNGLFADTGGSEEERERVKGRVRGDTVKKHYHWRRRERIEENYSAVVCSSKKEVKVENGMLHTS